MKRTDICNSDVFFSWTGADRDMKNKIVAHLRDHNISCTESDHACTGDFQQWSREAVSKSTVFLLLYTKNTPKSKYVPTEIDAFRELEDHYNRCVPVVTDFELYAKNVPDLANRESAVILDENGLTDQRLGEILHKVRSLICNRLFAIYRSATAPAYLRFESLLREMRLTEEFEHTKLYIDRSVTDEAGQVISDASVFCNTEDIIYLYGPAGSGKTCYIDQLRNAADEETLVLTLPCRELLNTKDLRKEMYEEFRRYCGNCDYYSEEGFQSLLSVKHLLLVLDGLDEIGTKECKDALFRAVRDYYRVNAESTTLLIISRSSADAEMWKMNGQTPKVMKLRSLEEDQIKAFGTNLFLLLGSPDKSDGFYVRVHDLAEEIRTNPLLLSQLAIIYQVKDEIPQSVVGIYDAVCEIMVDKIKPGKEMPAVFDEKIFQKISAILKCYSAECYHLRSQGKVKTTEQIFRKVLRDLGFEPDAAQTLVRYLQDRAILVGNEFYHKMLLEYFTAVYYYEQCFDDYDELENRDILDSLFDHYSDPYWAAVLQMFLIKADNCVDAQTTVELYRTFLAMGITDFTLLFDTCQKLVRHRETAQKALLTDILERSATGVYPPYGPLFWYVPEYDLYSVLLWALADMREAPCFTGALALTRDVCWIFGKYHTAEAANQRIDGKALLAKAALSGVRKGLCELFYQGSTDCTCGNDIYPRCFNVAEAVSWKETGQGVYGRMGTPFEDELGLYSHEMLREFGGEWVGIVSIRYDAARIEEILPTRSCRKLCGLFLLPTENTEMQRMAINDSHIRIVYLPENIEVVQFSHFPYARESVFSDENGLLYFCKKLILPDGITGIGARAFSGCSSLISIEIPKGVTEIGARAFSKCSSLTSIELPEGVTEIGWAAFEGCSSLTSIELPDSVTKIETAAFEGCGSLTSIELPEGVTTIEGCAFYGCSSLTSIKLPEGVTKIGSDAFHGCSSLTSIEIPKGVTEIGVHAFSGCSSLTSIEIPKGVTKIGFCAFYGCSSLTSIELPEGVTEIGDHAFSRCSSLTSIKLPEGVTKIGYNAFFGCSSLTSVKIPDSVTKIGTAAFEGCGSLTSIKLPEGVTKIGSDAFHGCSSLTSIELPENIKTIPFGVFEDCRALTSIELPEGVTGIGFYAFEGCSSLTSIKIPDSVTEIGNYAFSGCSSLVSIALPDKLQLIEEGVLAGCTALVRVSNCPPFCNRGFLGVSDQCVIAYREVKQSEILFRSETEILPEEFMGRKDITTITIPAGVSRIGSYAFFGCSSLTSIELPEGVTTIEGCAFYGCSSLTSITLPESLGVIEGDAFHGCRSLTSIKLPEGMTKIEGSVFGNCRLLTSIKIPEGVTEIGDYAFCDCSSLTSAEIPKGVTAIGRHAFYGCSSLTSVEIPKGVTAIGSYAFYGCSSLTSIKIPEGVTEIGEYAFSCCSSLTSIKIPEGVTTIEGCAFYGCSSLTSVEIPEGLTEIGRGAFSGCSSLTSAILPEGLTEIGRGAFSGCSSLTSIKIPEGVTEIKGPAFRGCSSLTSVVIPKAVRTIGNEAFAGCVGLREITLSRRFEDDLPRIFTDVDLSKVKITWI